jgi:hypothetical protein
MCDRLSELRWAMEYYALDFDPNVCSVSEAEAVLRHATVIKNMANTVAVLAAGRVAESNVWKRAGARSAAHDLAKKTGTGVGTAAGSLDTARRLRKLPKTAEAARRGELSEQQASLIADAADIAPRAEDKLLEKAKSGSLPELRDECAKAKAAANPNLDERRRKIHDQRFLREHTDTDGAWNLRARDNPEVGAAVMAALAPIVDQLFAKARAEGRRERPEAYAMDALAEMAQRASGGGADPKRSYSDTKVLARIDFDTLLRGYPIDGETCELVGYGPVAVSAIKDLIDSGNPFLVAIATRGIDVVGVAHTGRKFTAAQVSALQWRDPTCAAEGCNASKRLEMDHRHDWADTKVSLYEWADRLCCHDHDKKTRLGWALVEGSGKRAFVPPDDSRHPKNAGRAPPSYAKDEDRESDAA